MGKRIGVYKYIHALPRDAYGNRYHIGGRILSQKFGLGTVIGVARGGDGRTCVVCNFRAAYREGGVVVSKWRTWLVEETVRPTAKAQQPKEKPAYTEPFKKDEVKGADMATTADAKLDKIYVVMVVGGVAVAWCESFDKAVAVCDALTLGAKASGFAATYDVVEVKKWTA